MRRLHHLGAAAAAAVIALAGSVQAQDGARPFLTFQHAGLDRVFVDERDAGLRDALAMLPERVGELPGEIEDMPREVADMLELVLRTVARPARVAVVYDGDNPSGGLFGYGLLVSVRCQDEAQVRELNDAVMALVGAIEEEQGAEIPLEPSTRFEGMRDMMLPVGLLSFGPRESDDAWRYEIVVGTMNDPEGVFDQRPSLVDAPGFQTHATGVVDFSALTPLSRMATNMAGANAEQVGEVVGMLREMGLVGDDAMRMEFQSGVAERAMRSKLVIHRAAPHAEALSLSTSPLTAAELRAVPADALAVTIGKSSLASIDRALEQMAANGLPVAEGLETFEEQTGVNLVEDVLHSLGETMAIYSADSTGGGGLLSTVVLARVSDRDRFGEAMVRLTRAANNAIVENAEEAAPYVRIHRWSAEDDATLFTLRFPGLPVPLELSLGLTEDWLIAALTPQAAVAAARQAAGRGDGGLTANPAFAPLYREHGEGATSITFVDTARTIRSGYPLLALLSSALSNAVRSPGDPGAREPGLVLPTYGDLVQGPIHPTFQVTRWDGDALVTSWWGDRSQWVQAGGQAGVVSAAVPLIAAGIGAGVIGASAQEFGSAETLDGAERILETARAALLGDPVARTSAVLIGVQKLEQAPGGREALRMHLLR